jgi:tetratricopeptide (TPR) repeat protein
MHSDATAPADLRLLLSKALVAEREGRVSDSRDLCALVLRDSHLHPDAFNLLGRLSRQDGDFATAIALQRFVLVLAPGHARALADLDIALDAIVSTTQAESAFALAVAREPDITCHHRHPASLLPFVGMDHIERLLERVLALDPSFAPAHAALGNIHARRSRLGAAVAAYRLAAMLRWNWPDVHLALSYLYEALHDDSSTTRHRNEALTRKQLYTAATAGTHRSVLVLAAPGGATANTPLDFCINPAATALHVLYLTGDEGRAPDVPKHGVVFNAIEEADYAAPAIERAAQFIAKQNKPAINRPQHLARIRRSELRTTLQNVRHCTVPVTLRLARVDVETAPIVLPMLVRPIDTQGGKGLERITAVTQVREYLDRTAGEHFYVSPFVDYRNADGYYRKYRVIVIDGEAFPYHLAISDKWMVHYHSSLMEKHEWMRREEECFLREPQGVFHTWDTVFKHIAEAIGLDYFGVDCSVGPDGSILIFECGTAMFVHCIEPAEAFAYKYAYVPRIFSALEAMLTRRHGS